MRIGGVIWLVAVGCTGEPVDTGDTDDSPTPGPADTGPEYVPPPPPNRVDGAVLRFEAAAAWDPSREVWVGTIAGNGFEAQPPGVRITVVDSSFEQFCEVLVTGKGPTLPPADWVDGRRAVVGFELPAGESRIIDGCADSILPNEFEGDIGAAVARWTWGFGLSPLDRELAEVLEASKAPSEWNALQDLLVGATFYSNFLRLSSIGEEFLEEGTARGFEVDDKFAVTVGGTGERRSIDADDIFLGGDEFPQAQFVFDSRYEFGPAARLLDPVPQDTKATGDTGTP